VAKGEWVVSRYEPFSVEGGYDGDHYLMLVKCPRTARITVVFKPDLLRKEVLREFCKRYWDYEIVARDVSMEELKRDWAHIADPVHPEDVPD
jgi:hypothetical protein